MGFDAEFVKNDIVKWIREWFDRNGKGCSAVVGISGGKDSSVVAALCVAALGKDRVTGVLMPNGLQHDIDVSLSLVKFLDIKCVEINISNVYTDIVAQVSKELGDITDQAKNNLQPRLRMSVLYTVSQSINGRVANTCNLSEDWVGYSTRYGDSVGDFSPLSNLTVTEVKQVGKALNLPDMFIEKVPADGLCGKSDEENLGFSYAVLDRYIRDRICEDEKIKERIDKLHEMNKFKLELMESYKSKK